MQAWCNVGERSPKLEWQTLIMKTQQKQNKQTKSNDKERNEGCLPQALIFSLQPKFPQSTTMTLNN
jgi:hypothetical protein